MRTHQQIDARSLDMARAIVAKIDADPAHAGLQKPRDVCHRWHANSPNPSTREWLEILERPWEEIRAILLDESENGKRLRQTDPFCGILTPAERWAIYKKHCEAS
jgi:hypothetical protein